MSEPVLHIIVGQPVAPEKLSRAKELRREMTLAERRIWERVRANRLNGLRFRRQQVIDGFIADLYCHSAALVIELDGPVHEDQQDFDAARDRVFGSRGFTVLRFTNEEVFRDLEKVVGTISLACRRDLSPPAPLSEAERGE